MYVLCATLDSYYCCALCARRPCLIQIVVDAARAMKRDGAVPMMQTTKQATVDIVRLKMGRRVGEVGEPSKDMAS